MEVAATEVDSAEGSAEVVTEAAVMEEVEKVEEAKAAGPQGEVRGPVT